MKKWRELLIMTLIDVALIWYSVRQMNPDPSASIELFVLIPGLVMINLLIAFVFLFIKKDYAKLFLINTIISSIIMFFTFLVSMNRHQKQRYEIWTFEFEDKTYNITHSILDTTFYMTYSTNPGSSNGFLNGQFIENNNEIYLLSDKIKYMIRNDYLFGFTKKADSIKLTRQ